jgi:hypothetical protein
VLYLTTGRYDEAESEVRAAEKVGFQGQQKPQGDIKKEEIGRLGAVHAIDEPR